MRKYLENKWRQKQQDQNLWDGMQRKQYWEKVTIVNSYIKEERSRTSLVVQGVRNPPTGSGSMGSIPGPESFHMMQASTTTKAWVP